MQTIETVPQYTSPLQARLTDEAHERLRVQATIRKVTIGQIITELVIANLPAVVGNPKDPTA